MHLTRLAVAAVVLPLLYLSVVKLPPAFFFALVAVVSVLAQAEFYSMYRVRGLMKISGLVAGFAILCAMYFSKDAYPDVIVAAFLIISGLRLAGTPDPLSSLRDISPVLIALLYIPCSLGFQLLLRSNGPGWILFLFGCVWASDSLAYYAGRTLGKKKLYPEVSPNKTVAGAFGSLAGGALSGWLLGVVCVPQMGAVKAIASGFVIGMITIAGDLVESMFKRDAGVKDSGGIIPGHGGILDKIDGALFAGPVLYWTSRAFGLIS
jgi:phosphatidate cytidylyltransferase